MGLSATLLNCLLVFAGGGCGALSRYGVQNIGLLDHDKYIYTLFINMTGCMVIGILWALFNHWHLNQRWYLFALTGFLGGYTTYSAFSLDAIQLLEAREWIKAAGYIGATYIGGLLFCALGLFLTQKIINHTPLQ